MKFENSLFCPNYILFANSLHISNKKLSICFKTMTQSHTNLLISFSVHPLIRRNIFNELFVSTMSTTHTIEWVLTNSPNDNVTQCVCFSRTIVRVRFQSFAANCLKSLSKHTVGFSIWKLVNISPRGLGKGERA